MNKIVCFFDCFDITYDKRVREFVDEGYPVECYAYTYRDEDISNYKYYTIHHLGHYATPPSYLTRLRVYTTTIINIVRQYDPQKTLFIFFSLNTAFATLFCPKIKYIYQEDDMLFDRVNNKYLKAGIRSINKRIIRKSIMTFFASEGFAQYYFGKNRPENIEIFPNKLLPQCLNFPRIEHPIPDFNHLKFGFVGGVRYESLFSFSFILASSYPNHEFHFYGAIIDFSEDKVRKLESLGNVFFHGKFKAPDDLPQIYSSIDFVVATYDTQELNPKFAEPNKLYESIFFEVPIIVSNDSYLANRVTSLGSGFDVDPYDEKDIKVKINAIDAEQYNRYLDNIKSIPKEKVINNNKKFFDKFKLMWNKM